MNRILAVGLICFWIMGCGGGGGGDDSSSGIPPEPEHRRAQAFKDEALRVAEANAVVLCQMIVCSIADQEREFERLDGVVVHACQWDCLESRIDDSDETRNYLIHLVWERFPDGCFEPPGVLIAEEILSLCVPNQERF